MARRAWGGVGQRRLCMLTLPVHGDPRPDPIRPDPPIPTHPTRGTSTLTWPSEHVEHHSEDHIVHGGDVLVQLQLCPERAQGAGGPAKAPPDTTLF